MLTIAVSSRSLFHLEEANLIFETEGVGKFNEYMRSREDYIWEPGIAFSLIKKFLSFRGDDFDKRNEKVRVVVLSRKNAEAGISILRSIQHYGLDIETAVFTSGDGRLEYAKALNVDLFLSASAPDTIEFIANGIAAATIIPRSCLIRSEEPEDAFLRIAFDGDAVIFSDEADCYYREHGLFKFIESEKANSNNPLAAGPFKNLFLKICDLQKKILNLNDSKGIKTALVTARSAQSHGRPISSLRSWNLSFDVTIFAGGLEKGPLVKAFNADFYFDDMRVHIESAAAHNIAAGHVPHGLGGITVENISSDKVEI